MNLYTLIASAKCTGGMALVAAETRDEAVKICDEDPSMRDFQFCDPNIVCYVEYSGPKGVIDWSAYEGGGY